MGVAYEEPNFCTLFVIGAAQLAIGGECLVLSDNGPQCYFGQPIHQNLVTCLDM